MKTHSFFHFVSKNHDYQNSLHDIHVLPLSEVLDDPVIFLPRRMSRGLELLPIFGVGGKEASMKGIDSSS